MAKAGDAAKARKDRKDNVKKGQKKKFKNRNSIGVTKKKVGSAGRYVTRTQAVKKLQVTLKDFRRLCILKGIYPREPRKKFKGNTTYYFAKDVAFLAHEPLLDKFREQKAFLKKIRRAVGRHEKKVAMRLDKRRPVYRLDHLIRERYPTFDDALRDVDDALCLIHLFASISSSRLVPPQRVHKCLQLAREWQSYVARTHSLRKVFISIKGFYYQAEINGVTVTWVVPHTFAQQPTMQVDYRVMLSFLELYETLLSFVNFKLFHTIDLQYPPPIDEQRDSSGAHLAAMIFKSVAAEAPQLPPLALPAPLPEGTATPKPLDEAQLSSLKARLSSVVGGEKADADMEAEEATEANAEGEGDDELAELGGEGSEASEEARVLSQLFSSCVFFCGRETPIASLELLALSCGGTIGWEGEASPLARTDASITHQVVDRPLVGETLPDREYIQPQWLYDCLNARALLPAHPYAPGGRCPPHLSPFLDGNEGYTPIERIRQAIEAARARGEGGAEGDLGPGEAEEESESDDGSAPGDEGDEEDEEDESESEDEDELDSEDEEAAEYARELKAETAGRSYNETTEAPRKRKGKGGAQSAEAKREEEAKELAMMMMSRKKRRLYDRMQHGIQKRAAASDVLQQKRKALEANKAKGSPKKKGKKA